MVRYIAFDSETGGTHETCSLLTVYFSILDESLNEIDSLSLFLKEDNGKPYIIETEGMEVNKINLSEHDEVAIPYSSGGQKLREFIKRHSDLAGDKLIPVGHNVHFDIQGVTNKLLSVKNWNQFVSYRIVDTQVFARCLQIKGVIPMNESISLGNLIKKFNIKLEGNQHEAKYDTLATVEVLKRLLLL